MYREALWEELVKQERNLDINHKGSKLGTIIRRKIKEVIGELVTNYSNTGES